MTRGRLVAGTLGGLLLVAEGAMHSLIGWPAVRRTLLGATTQPDVVQGLVVPWHLAGLGMAGLALVRPDATFALFIVPGLLCLAAASGRARPERNEAHG
jgi:hypothetical protein